jgi:hypothetical protein
MARYIIDRTARGSFDDADLPDDATLEEMRYELIAVGDLLQEKFPTKFLHLILNRYIRELRNAGDGRKAIAAELFNVVNWQTYNAIVRREDEYIPLGEEVE